MYEKLMKNCLKLAKKAEGHVSPNPMVGAILINDSGKIIGEGYHHKAGLPHAEVNAINNATEDVKNSTLIVNLEPCSHYGKTPPCCDLIIKKGIKKVVIGNIDSNPMVKGNGIKKLKAAGIEVITGVLNEECRKLNEVFFKNTEENKIFVASKIAATLDGKIALENGDSKWITSSKARNEVQKIRNRYDSILTSSNTGIKDNPSLTCRMKNGVNPVRILLDKDLKTPLNSKIFNNDGVKIFVFSNKKATDYPDNIQVIKTPLKNAKLDLNFVLDYLYNEGIKSVLIEAGGTLNGAFLKENLIDKLYYFIAPKIFGDRNCINSFEGINLSSIEKSKIIEFQKNKIYYPDILLEGYIKK